jgi:hypothetical protein
MKELPKISKDFRGNNLLVVNVWLEKAIEFCGKLSQITGKTSVYQPKPNESMLVAHLQPHPLVLVKLLRLT